MKKIILLFLTLFCINQIWSQDENWIEVEKTLPIPYYNNHYSNFGNTLAIDGDYAVVGQQTSYYDEFQSVYILFNDGSTWQTIARLSPSDSTSHDNFGYSVSISGDVVVVGAPDSDADGLNKGGVYVYVKPETGWVDMTETTKVYAESLATEAHFGYSVSISGNVIIVGAHRVTDFGSIGSVYIFEKPGQGWTAITETAQLTRTNGSNDYFGHIVRISDNVAVVGSRLYSSGKVYVYQKPEDGWADMNQTAILSSSDFESGDYFGMHVDISENVIVVASPGSGSNVASAYLFEKPIEGWSDTIQTAKFSASDWDVYESFGSSVCIDGDVVVVGAIDNNDIEGSGSYIFKKPITGWTDTIESAKLTLSDPQYIRHFGVATDISGDIILVGDDLDNSNGIDAGGVFVFEKDQEDWTDMNESYLWLPVQTLNNKREFYGFDIAIDKDYAVVSSMKYNETGCIYVLKNINEEWVTIARLTPSLSGVTLGWSIDIYDNVIVTGARIGLAGKVFIYEKDPILDEWIDMTETAILTASDSEDLDGFGSSVCIDGNVIAVGASGADNIASDCGVVYVFQKPGIEWVNCNEIAKLTASDGSLQDAMGKDIAIYGDVIVAGAHQNDACGSASGAAYVFEKTQANWTNMSEVAKLIPDDGASGDYFGFAVDIHDDVIVVGAHQDDIVSSQNGSGYVFVKPILGWNNMTQTAKLTASDPHTTHYLGQYISIHNDIIALASAHDDVYGYLSGSVYLYKRPDGGWTDITETKKIIPSDGEEGDCFGQSVAVYNEFVGVGAYKDSDNGTFSGAAYWYSRAFNLKFIVTESGVPITGASVTVSDYDVQYTDFFGETTFSVVPNDNINYLVSVSGYDEINSSVSVINEDETVYIELIPTKFEIFTSKEIKVFPNPSSKFLYIENANGKTIELFDLTGKLLNTYVCEGDKLSISLDNIQDGAYLILIEGLSYKVFIAK